MNPPANKGFSLTEILVVITLLVVISTVALVTLRGSGGASLTTAGSKLAASLEAARVNAINEGKPTAVVLTNHPGANPRRTYTILQYQNTPAPGWKQISPWETLPDGVIVDSGPDSKGRASLGLLPDGSPQINPPLPSNLRVKAVTLNPANKDYGYLVFMPNGGLYDDGTDILPDPYVIRLVEGRMNGDQVQYTALGAGSRPPNYFEIVVSPITGRIKILRP